MSVDFSPLRDKVLIRPLVQTKTESGLYLPQMHNKTEEARDVKQGTVLAIGTGIPNEKTGVVIPLVVKVGDTVVFCNYAATQVRIAGEDLAVVRENDIQGIVTE